jgi:hypothetical protein
MKKYFYNLTMMSLSAISQNVMTPEILWKLGRVSVLGISTDTKTLFTVLAPSVEENKSNSKFYTIPVNGGQAVETPIIKNLYLIFRLTYSMIL